MSRKRRSYETGHKPKLLVVIDDTEECDRAVYFASRRAARIGGNVIMLRVMETHDQSQQWLGVADIMRAEAREEADAQLAKFTARAKAIAGIAPECVVREGDTAEEILNLIDEDEDGFHSGARRRHRLGRAGSARRHHRPRRRRLSHSGRNRAGPFDGRRDRRAFGVVTVIPGRAERREPGIHNPRSTGMGVERLSRDLWLWIPGAPLRGAPE